MKKRFVPLISILFLLACSADTTVQIARHPLIQCVIDSASWQAANYFFVGPTQAVAYPANTSQSGKLYNRLTLQAFGKDNKGSNLQLNITLDAPDITQLTGIYSPSYTTERGLYAVQLYNLDNNNLSAYNLYSNDSSAAVHVQRQSQTERLVSGTFGMTLYNTRDTTQKIHVTNGTLTDIHY